MRLCPYYDCVMSFENIEQVCKYGENEAYVSLPSFSLHGPSRLKIFQLWSANPPLEYKPGHVCRENLGTNPMRVVDTYFGSCPMSVDRTRIYNNDNNNNIIIITMVDLWRPVVRRSAPRRKRTRVIITTRRRRVRCNVVVRLSTRINISGSSVFIHA